MILDFIKSPIDGDTWETICNSCYRDRYQNEHYHEIPAAHRGDAGIEGFTRSGIVYQCYCPEREYSDDDLYAHQRDKLTTDINKLIDLKNAQRLKKLGIDIISEWHFVTPEYRDSRIISHANTKKDEVHALRAKGPKTMITFRKTL